MSTPVVIFPLCARPMKILTEKLSTLVEHVLAHCKEEV